MLFVYLTILIISLIICVTSGAIPSMVFGGAIGAALWMMFGE